MIDIVGKLSLDPALFLFLTQKVLLLSVPVQALYGSSQCPCGEESDDTYKQTDGYHYPEEGSVRLQNVIQGSGIGDCAPYNMAFTAGRGIEILVTVTCRDSSYMEASSVFQG